MAKETNANIGFEIGKYIDEAMEAIEKENTTLKGVLPKNYGTPDCNKKTTCYTGGSKKLKL